MTTVCYMRSLQGNKRALPISPLGFTPRNERPFLGRFSWVAESGATGSARFLLQHLSILTVGFI